MKYHNLFFGLLSLAAVSCTLQEITSPEYDAYDDELFYATIDEQPGADTRVYADDQLRVLWNADDRITIFNKNTYNQQYRFTGEDGDNAGAIKKVSGDGSPDSEALSKVYAVYPYRELTQISGDGGVITTSMPSEQTYLMKSFGRGANMMVSVTDDSKLRFKNVGGYLSLKFYGDGVSVSSINLRSNNGEALSGACSITTSGDVPVLSMSDGASDEVTLVCESPVALGATSAEAVQFIFVLPPQTLSGGFTVKVTTPEGAVFEKSSTSPRVIGRSSITPLGAMEVVPELPGNIVFADPEFKRLCVENWDTNQDGELSYAEAAAVTSLEAATPSTKAGEGISVFAGSSITSADELVFFENLRKIVDHAFENCSSLSSITFPETIVEIGDFVFDGCSALITVVFKPLIPPTIGEEFLEELCSVVIVVPKETIDTYISEWWSVSDNIQSDEVLSGPNSIIYYTSIDGTIVEPCYSSLVYETFGANIVSNEYVDGRGIITFDGRVTRLGHLAFAHCKLASIVIPESVSVITGNCLYACPYLTEIKVSPTNPVFDSRDDCNAIIRTATNTLVAGCLGTFIPSSVTAIGDRAFQDTNITSINIPESVSSLGDYSFYGCTQLPSIVIPSSVSSIGRGAFAHCISLGSITIPLSVTEIGAEAFSYCTGLSSLNIPPSVVSIGQSILANSTNISTITVDNGNPNYDSRNGCNAIIESSTGELLAGCINTIIPETVTRIGYSSFKGSGIESITIPDSVTSIDSWAFAFSNISSISIPSSVKAIESSTFQGCYNLVDIIIPASVEVIADDAFSDCNSLNTFSFPASVLSIGNNVLRNCRSLISIYVKSVNPPGGNDMFEETNNCPIYVPEVSVEEYRSAWPKYSSRIRPMGSVIPDDPVDNIVFKDETAKMICVENWDLNGDGELSYAEAASVTSVGDVFSGSNIWSFEEFEFFTGLTCLDEGAFANSNITYITLPESLREIGDRAFCMCENLHGIVFPSSIESFGTDVFDGARYLQSFYVMAENPPLIHSLMLDFIDCTVFVPDNSLDRYLEDFNWRRYTILPISSADPSYGYRTDYGMVDRDGWED